MVLALTSCTVKQDESAKTETCYNYDLSGYVKVGDYKNLKVTAFDTEPTEEEIQKEIDDFINGDYFYKEVDREAQMGDKVDISYVGKYTDGEAFEGGTADNQKIILGNSGYIEGFDESVVGMKKGETKDCPMKFPDDYNNPELQGKDVIFTITLNAIYEPVKGELTDEFLAEYNEYTDYFTTVDELREYCRNYLANKKQSSEDNENQNALIKALKDISEFYGELPEADLARNLEAFKTSVENSYSQYIMYYGFDGTKEEFISQMTGEEVTDIEAYYKERAEEVTKNELILAAVAKAEKLSVTEDEYKEFISQYQNYGAESEEALVEQAGGEAQVKWYLLSNKVMDYLTETVTFVDKDGNEVEYPHPTEEPVPTDEPAPADEDIDIDDEDDIVEEPTEEPK